MSWRMRAAESTLTLLLAGCAAAALPVARPEPATGRAGVPAAEAELVIRFLDVGQGDATLVSLGREFVLIDGGRGRDIVQVLAEYHVDSLVAAIASHNHDDHVGGLVAVVADLPIRRFYSNGRRPTNDNARDLERWLDLKRVPRPPPPWQPFNLGDAKITVLPSPLDPSRVTENSSSLAVLIERGPFRALLTGDSEADELNAWLVAGQIPEVDVLKAAHHGARNGVTPGWLDRTKPRVVVVSVGLNNTYGHPDPWALRYYQLRGRKVYRTDQHGTIAVTVDPTGHYEVGMAGPVER